MARIAVLSDIHANLSALELVLRDVSERYTIDGFAILGDLINYGMRPNEVIHTIKNIKTPVMVNLSGNHEKALMDNDTARFSTDRGRQILAYTRNRLTEDSRMYLLNRLSRSGLQEIQIDGKTMLFVHGSLSDPFWGKMDDAEISDTIYTKYDYVFSGHSHIPNMMERFYHDATRADFRNKKRTIFLNPGSVGQPRNHNPQAQYLFVDTELEIFHFNSVKYDIDKEQSLYTAREIDDFYRERLAKGI